MPVSDISKIRSRVLWITGAHNNVWPAAAADDRFNSSEIDNAIIETESEVVHALCEGYHPMRNTFLAWSSDLANEDQLPAHIGQVAAVKIKGYTGGTFALGESTSRENIKLWRANTNNIFDTIAHNASGSSLSGYFNITGETLTFTGATAQAKVCSYTPDYATPALQIDPQFDGALVAGSIVKLNKLGVPQALIQSYGNLYANLLGLIRQGNQEMPDISDAQAVQ